MFLSWDTLILHIETNKIITHNLKIPGSLKNIGVNNKSITSRSKMIGYFNMFSSNNLGLMKSVNKHGHFFIQNIQNYKKAYFTFIMATRKYFLCCYEKLSIEFQIPYLSYFEFRIANQEKLSHRWIAVAKVINIP